MVLGECCFNLAEQGMELVRYRCQCVSMEVWWREEVKSGGEKGKYARERVRYGGETDEVWWRKVEVQI